MRTFALAAAALSFSVAGAHAADPLMFSNAPMAYNWTGFYVGASVGYAGGEFQNNVSGGVPGPTGDSGGFTGGLHVGYDYQLHNNWVIGVEADAALIDIEGSTAPNTFEEQWMATLRARAGYAFGRYLAYGTAGVALTQVEVTNAAGSDDETIAGFTVGAGLEGFITDNWTARLEYLYVSVPETNFSIGAFNARGGSHNHVGRLGVSYRF